MFAAVNTVEPPLVEYTTALIFEADNTAVVHNMDTPEVYPYKAPQMRLVFDAFARMLSRHARRAQERAA